MASEKLVKPQEEARPQQTAPADEESQVKHEAAPGPSVAVTATASLLSKQRTVQTPSIELNIPGDQATSIGLRKSTSNEAAVTTDSAPNVQSSDLSPSLKDVIPDTEDGKTKTVLGSSLQKTCSDATHRVKATKPANNSSSSTCKVSEVDAHQSGKGSSVSDELKSSQILEPKKNLPERENDFSVDENGLPMLTAEKCTDESRRNDSQKTPFTQVTIATTQLPSRTNSVESKLSVAVVSNSPPSMATTTMNKSISPVIKAVSSSKPVDIVTSVSVPSTVTVTTNTTVSSSGNVVYTRSITLPVMTSAVRPTLNLACSSVSLTSAGKSLPLPTSSGNAGQLQKISNQIDAVKHSLGTVHGAVSSTVTTHSSSIPVISSKSNVLVTNVPTRGITSVPMQAKVCIVTTVGNTKVAIHTLNSVAEQSSVHHIATAQRAVLKPSLIQSGTRIQNAVKDNVSKGGTATSIMIRDITRKADPSDSNALDAFHTKLEMLKPKVQAGVMHGKDTGQSQDVITNAKHIEKFSGQSNKVVHYNLPHGQLRNPVAAIIPNVSPISKSRDTKNALQDHIDSIVNASRGVNQNLSQLPVVSAVGTPKSIAMNCGSGVTALQSKVAMTTKQSEVGVVNTVDSRHSQVLGGHEGRTPGQVTTNQRGNQLTATSNLDSGTATAAIQAVAAHVKATQGAAPQACGTSPPEHQKRQSKGISILKPLYDKEFELDDNEMDPKVPQVPVPQKKSAHDTQTGAKSVAESHPKVAYDSTAFSIAQILDHAKRAMAEEKQQKETKTTTSKEKSKGNVGKGAKTPKQGKTTSTNKAVPTAAVPNPVAHDFPFSSNVHLTNFVQKSKQTPAVVNSATHTPAHPIMAPEFHLNLTESVQKVMQAIPGSDALSPSTMPTKGSSPRICLYEV